MNIKKSNLKKIGDANSGISIFNNSWENISMKNAIKENLIFNNNKQNFELAKNKLYYVIEDNKMLISEKNVSEIVYVKNNDIYYIAGDSLYYYSYLNNEIKLFSNSEWNFNYKNIMFVFD